MAKKAPVQVRRGPDASALWAALTADEKTVALAIEVHELHVQAPATYARLLAEFGQEALATDKQRRKAEDAEQDWLLAVAEELRGGGAHGKPPILTGALEPPHQGWTRVWLHSQQMPVVGGNGAAFQGGLFAAWCPPEVAAWRHREDRRPGENPSLALKAFVLASVHDKCLPDSTPILPKVCHDPLEALRSGDEAAKALFAASMGARGYISNAKVLDTLKSWLMDLRAAVDAALDAGMAGQVEVANGGEPPARLQASASPGPADKDGETAPATGPMKGRWHVSPSEATRRDAENLAVEVETLWCKGKNPDVFAEQIKAFRGEVAKRIAEWERLEKATRDAMCAILQEVESGASSNAQRRLTDTGEGPPGWEWAEIDPASLDAKYPIARGTVRGHVPAEVAAHLNEKDRAQRGHERPWTLTVPFCGGGDAPLCWKDRPSDAVVFALLAALRDYHLRTLAPILDRADDVFQRALRNPDDQAVAAAFGWANSVTSGALRHGLAEARTFLDRAREYLSTPHGKGTADGEGKAPTTGQGPNAKETRLPPGDQPDEKGFVRNPSDKAAYAPAKQICADYPTYARNHKALIRILDAHPEIRRWKPNPARLCIHLGDWRKYVNNQESIGAKVLAEAKKRLFWVCGKCHLAFEDNHTDISR